MSVIMRCLCLTMLLVRDAGPMRVSFYTYHRPPLGTAILAIIWDLEPRPLGGVTRHQIDFVSDRPPARFSGIHGWITEVIDPDTNDLGMLFLYWNCRGEAHLNRERFCIVR